MSDLEGLTRRLILNKKSKVEIIERLKKEYLDFKNITLKEAELLSNAIYEECIKSDINSIENSFIKRLIEIPIANVSIGKQGVGCRGLGDFFVHKLIAELSTTKNQAFLSPNSLDDAGAIQLNNYRDFKGKKFNDSNIFIVSKMEGIHSRLSDFPFICGFHVTRAALRDLYVKGAKPISIMVDVHLGDDADVGKLFDFMAGISTISELTNIPITAGSTLRIGGDMVIGDRLVGGVAAVGVCKKLFARRNIHIGDKILMTEGAGGGTITTTAIYSGNHDVVKETLNIKFLEACEKLLSSDYIDDIHNMCDVTNGGLRGDLYEINYEAKCGVIVHEAKVKELVNSKVLNLLNQTDTDYLGISLDSLLIYCDQKISEKIINDLKSINIKCCEIGFVDNSNEVKFIFSDKKSAIVLPRFRESAYTKIKKEIGDKTPKDHKRMEKTIEAAAKNALNKRKEILNYIISN
jgi:hydrogenase expression/formation protein